MLRTKSFDILDSDGINQLLTTHRLAEGAHMIISDGKVCIPYEDGEPENNDQKRIRYSELRNKLILDREIIQFSQKVNDLQIADAKERVAVAKAKMDGETSNQAHKEAQKRFEGTSQVLDGLDNQYRMNEYEITRLTTNIDLYEEELKKLSK